MRDVKVVAGSRGPEAREKARMASAPDKSALAQIAAMIEKDKKARPDKRVPLKDEPHLVTYQSRAAMYRLTLEAPSDTFDPGTGKRTVHRGITWQFRDGLYVSKSEAEQKLAEASDRYGLNGSFWRAADAAKADVQRAVSELIRTVKGAPENIRSEVVAALAAEGGDTFTLPVIEETSDESTPAEDTPQESEG